VPARDEGARVEVAPGIFDETAQASVLLGAAILRRF
jgi:hypothetical protein